MRKPVETAADPFAPEARELDAQASPVASTEGVSRRRGWRRLLQVNLLMVLVALALVSGYFAMRRNLLVPYLEQKVAREELAKRGAQFSAVPASPKWAQALFQISDDDFQNVEMIKLEGSDGIRDADLIHLHKFPHLRRLYLAATRITDDGMKHLRYCTKLRRVSLWDTQVGDAGIRELETLQDLRIIDIHRTWTTDAALETLGKLPALEELVLDDATTKRGIDHLSGLKNLRRLNLRSTSLEADCLTSLAGCPIEILEAPPGFADRETAKDFRHVPRLRALALSLPGATDEDLEWLAAMKNLRILSLSDLQAEGAFARHVGAMRELSELHLASDRFQKRYVEEALKPPRLSKATITVPFEPGELPTLPRNENPRMPYFVSPWMNAYHSAWQSGRVAESASLERSRDEFAVGGITSFENRSKQYMTVEMLGPLLAQRDLTELSLENWEFAPGALAALAQLDRLKLLSFDRCRFDPEELKSIAGLPNLRSIVVRDAPVRDEHLAAFVAASRLEALEVNLTDASAATVLAVAKKESLKSLSVLSTNLDDTFLDEIDAILASRAESTVELVVRDGAPPGSLPHYRFWSTGFSTARAQKFSARYMIPIGIAKEPGVEAPNEYWGVWPAEASFGWMDRASPEGLELSPLKTDLPVVERLPDVSIAANQGARRIAYAQLAYAHVWDSFQGFDVSDGPGSVADDLNRALWSDWRLALFRESPVSVQIPLDRFGAGPTRELLRSAPRSLALALGPVPSECLAALAECEAQLAVLGAGCKYDDATLRAIARMPRLESVHFGTCRKPTPEEIAILYESPTLRTIEFEHRGEPIYFDEIARPDREANSVSLTGKVVYDAEDAIRERPKSLILANFEKKLWPSILSDRRSITEVRLRDDWPNQLKFHFRLEVLQREQEESAEVDPADRSEPADVTF